MNDTLHELDDVEQNFEATDPRYWLARDCSAALAEELAARSRVEQRLAERTQRLSNAVIAGERVAAADINRLEREYRAHFGNGLLSAQHGQLCRILRRAIRRRERSSMPGIARRYAWRRSPRPRARARRRRATKSASRSATADPDGSRPRRRPSRRSLRGAL